MIKAKRMKKFSAANIVAYTVLVLASVLVILPFTVILATSLQTYVDSVKVPFKFFRGYLDF